MKLYLVIAFVILFYVSLSCVNARGGRGGGSRGRGGGKGKGGGSFFGRIFGSKSSGSHSTKNQHSSNSNSHHSPGGSNSNNNNLNIPQHSHHAYETHSNNFQSSNKYGHNINGGFNQQMNQNNNNYGRQGSYGYSSAPGTYYNPPISTYQQPQTIFIQSNQLSKPSLGQLTKEAAVNSIVDTAVRASVNRVLHGGIYNHHYGGYSSANVGKNNQIPINNHTQITYNNYYGNSKITDDVNQTIQSVTNTSTTLLSTTSSSIETLENDEELKFTSPLGYVTFKHEIEQLSEELLRKDVNNVYNKKYITVKLQGLKTDDNVKDDAIDNLLTIEDENLDSILQEVVLDINKMNEYVERMMARLDTIGNSTFNGCAAWNIPTIKALLLLHDNYELDAMKNEIVTEQHRNEESKFIDLITNTTVMNMTMNFLIDKGYIADDVYEFKNTLKKIWFTRFQRFENIYGSSGFEYVFLAERINNGIIGLHNWIYYAKREEDKQLNYLGYIGHLSLNNNGAFIKVRSSLNNTASNVTTFFIGFSPELEMSLYTLCFYVSPWYPCPIKLDGNQFTIFVTRHRLFDNDILVSADTDLYIPPPTSPIEVPLTWRPPHHGIGKRLGNNASQNYSTIFLTKTYIILLLIIFKLF